MITTEREREEKRIKQTSVSERKINIFSKRKFLFFVYINGLFVVNDETVVVLLLNDDGISGGGNVEPLVNVGLFEVLSCSSVGGFVVLVNGFGVRAGVTPNGLVPEKIKEEDSKRIKEGVTLWFGN